MLPWSNLDTSSIFGERDATQPYSLGPGHHGSKSDTFEDKAWGWILMTEEAIHVLELGIEFDGNAHVFIDAWML
ncbi:hypothetical protein IH601_00585 [Candidatus Bipolaricaulota bacterium]|nr:hypothetical protein [Candidatus Bipolaricaulota bacterium]